jgi:hypothetical protein
MKNNDIFKQIGTRLGELVKEKNTAYGDSFRDSPRVIEVLFPNGIKPDQYINVLVITRILDKIFRIANKPLSKKDSENSWQDIAGYAILMLGYEQEKEEDRLSDYASNSKE